MLNHTTRAGVLALSALLLAASGLEAQQRQVGARVPSAAPARGATAAAPSREEVRAWYGELQQIGARLQSAHERAMAGDARLRTTQQTLFADIKTGMERTDPSLAQLAGRAQALEAEARRARQAGNRERLRTLAAEASQIQGRFLAAQNRVMAQPAIAQRMRAYETQLHQKMLQAEPQLDQLLARSRDLQARLARVARARQQQTGARRQ